VKEGPPHPSVLKDAFGGIFAKYTAIDPALEELLLDFHTVNVEFVQSQSFPFQKFTTFLELAAWVFESSFEGHKSRQESFEEFKEVVIRHSLFRQPYSVNIFNERDVKEITRFWLDTFDRYYEQY